MSRISHVCKPSLVLLTGSLPWCALGVTAWSEGNEPADLRAQFFTFCDLAAAELQKEITPFVDRENADPATHHMPFFEDAHAVRALAAAYDMTGNRRYLEACRRWSDRIISYQSRMISQGAYYMNKGRAPGRGHGQWNVADSGSIAMGVLATAVRCNDPADQELRYVGDLLLRGGQPNVSRLLVWEVMTWGMMSYAERSSPGALYRNSIRSGRRSQSMNCLRPQKNSNGLEGTMRGMLSLCLLLGLSATLTAQDACIPVIPKPAEVRTGEGVFRLTPQTKILVERGPLEVRSIGRRLAEKLAGATGHPIALEELDGETATGNTILLTTAEDMQRLGEEGYELKVTPEAVAIRAATPAGVFYGVQTLRQLLPPEFEAGKPVRGVAWTVPCVEIEDRPRFTWRAMHLDVARHFFDKDFVKKYIDHLAAYKMNVLHLYLTDDQGWRIEIKRYPKLTEIGAWREGTVMHKRGGQPDDRRYGGYFTQDDIREIVEHARERFVTVVPGISMPGHSQAALAAYPELSSTGGPFQVWTRWGISKEVMDPGKEEVFEFVEGVLAEVIELFPSQYIHTGGDEVPRDRWKASPFAQARMKHEGLANEDELQSYFTRRVERFLNSQGRRLIGWDEILEGGLAPNAVVMSWRGTAGGISAARSGHDAIMTPNRQTYFNYAQDPSRAGPGHTGGLLTLRTVYHFEPTEGMTAAEAKHVLGGQACLWTEYVPTPADVEYLLFPRLFAMAEVLWSPKHRRDDKDFLNRVPAALQRLDEAGVNYYRGGEY